MPIPTPSSAPSVREEIEALAAKLRHHMAAGEPDAAREALTTALKRQRLVPVLVTTKDAPHALV
jgi:hypothetical protein